MKYWVWSDNKAAGPYSAEELGRLPAVGPKTLIRRAGAADEGWTPLEKMPSLLQYLLETWGKDGPPPPPPLLCQKCGSAIDDDAVYCDHCGRPNPHEPERMDDEPRREDMPPSSSFGKPASSTGDVGNLVGTAVLVVVGGFIFLGGVCSDGGEQPSQTPSRQAQEQGRSIPVVEYASKSVEETLELRNFHWNEYDELAFEVHFKGNFAEGGTLRFEVYDERGVVIFSGEAASFSGGANKKVFEARVMLASERRRRARRIVFDF